MGGKICGEAYRTMRVCVDSYADREMRGRAFHPLFGEGGRRFPSMMQLLVDLDSAMDEANCPQSFTSHRTFARSQEGGAVEACMQGRESGRLATFAIRMLFRQHASWQGTVTWVESGAEEAFRSVLELLFLLDSALVCASDEAGGGEGR